MNNETKWWPYRLACIFLYGSLPGIKNPSPGFVVVVLPELCSYLKVPSMRLREYIKECERLGILQDVELSRGIATFKVVQSDIFLDKED